MKPGYRAWTPGEDDQLRVRYQSGESLEAIASSFGRSLSAVESRLRRKHRELRGLPDFGSVTDARERWGRGTPGRIYWTEERTETALRAFIARSVGMLPGGFNEYTATKRGDPSLPTFVTIRKYLLSPDSPTLSHVWLRLGAPRARVKTLGGEWTESEIDYLLSAAGSLRLVDIAKRLHRSYGACRRKLYDHGVEARNNQGYMSAQQVADEYGCDVGRVKRFIASGFLPATLLHGNRYAIDPEDAERLSTALTAPASRGKGWRVADGMPVPPTARRSEEPIVITRYRSAADQLRQAV